MCGSERRRASGARPDPGRVAEFRSRVLEHYREQGRDLPWRHTRDPYRILVSEIMLQQTQVSRVLSRYGEFLERFPDWNALAAASFRDVLIAWQGLGYNRRALALREIARRVRGELGGRLPDTVEELTLLPGVGRYTASAVCVFAFNRALAFIETNIRSALLHEFFPGREGVTDREIMPLVEACLDREDPRRWYHALMDYGAALKKTTGNPSRRSAHHVRQTPFEGSDRQVRSGILKALLRDGALGVGELARLLGADRDRVRRLAEDLTKEGLVRESDGRLVLP